MKAEFEQDIAISYAGEDWEIARSIAKKLRARGLAVFFARSQQAELLGERLEDVLAKKYGATSRYVVVLVSQHYPVKDWARFELKIAKDEEKQRKEVFILPLLLDDERIAEIPPDKVGIDLREVDLEEAVDLLADKVALHRGDLVPRQLFDRAFRAWKLDGFVPGSTKSDLFWTHSPTLELDEERTEFLLKCPSSSAARSREAIMNMEPAVLAAGARRLLDDSESPNFRLAAIRYLGVADSEAAEEELWVVYQDETLHLNDRARALELLWKCPSERSRKEPKGVLLDEEAPWLLRQAAAVNALWGELEADTEKLLERALRDPRREVRSKVIDAILRFRLEDLSPALIEAYRRDRSRKGKREIKDALRHFNGRRDVIEFGKENAFTDAFYQPPPYIHDWEEAREEGWV